MNAETLKKFDLLKETLAARLKNGICLAFSGGVDSALLLHLCVELSANIPDRTHFHAITFSNGLQSGEELDWAETVARRYGVPHRIIPVPVLDDPDLHFNPPDRCYRCKKRLFSTLLAFASEHGLCTAIDGSNADDALEYRPGRKALRELGIFSPLAEFGIRKSEICAMAELLGVSAAKRPSTPCLATRFPYGAELRTEDLRRVEDAECLLKDAGFPCVRVRLHGGIARIEVPREHIAPFIAGHEALLPPLKALGFHYLTLDLEGFRSGSMDLGLPPQESEKS